MSCFPCFGGGKKKDSSSSDEGSSNRGSNAAAPTPAPAPMPLPAPAPVPAPQKQEHHRHKSSVESVTKEASNMNIAAQAFTFRELAAATKHFSPDCVLGEGSLGKVYKGCIESTGEVVAVKKLDRNGVQGNREFLVEVLMLSLLHHPNLVTLFGYCADGDQRLLVHDFMQRGSLADHLFELSPEHKPLDWYARMRIAFGAAQGLEYLHDRANPPVIYGDLRSSNILLDDLFTPKLSDFGQTKLGPGGEKSHAPSMMMGSYGYCAPEYERSGQLTPKSDVYSFGVVLLELISGRRAIDTMKPINEQNLVTWAQPMFKDQKRYPELVDPLLKDDYPAKGLNQVVAVAAMCLQDEASVRPLVADLVIALSFLFDAPPTPKGSPTPASAPAPAPAPAAPHDKSSSSSDSSSDEDEKKAAAVAADRVQMGRKSTRKSSRSSSRRSSRHESYEDDDGSSRRYSNKSSSHRDVHDEDEDDDDDDDDNNEEEDGSSSSKHSHRSPRGSERSGSNRGSLHGSGRYSSRHYEEYEHHDDEEHEEHEEHEESE